METTTKVSFFTEGDVKTTDQELYEMLCDEETRQIETLNLIASENYTSQGVLQILGTPLQNKYAEGYPGARYYRGTEFVDKVEILAMKRALKAFHLDDEKWGVNVQPLSGTPANFEVFTALVGKDERIMGLYCPDGGHLSHGHIVGEKKMTATSEYFQTHPYYADPTTGLIDYDKLEKDAEELLPRVIVAGYSTYPRDLDYKRFREICNKVGAYLMVDMAHYCGLVAAKQLSDPFEYADVVTTTTHKILRGPRGGMIFYRKDLESLINFAVFPQHQGGPHMNQIAALAYALKDVASDEYTKYAEQVIKNAKAMAEAMISKGYDIATGGTDNHMVVWNVKPLGLNAPKIEAALEKLKIDTNKCYVLGDTPTSGQGGVRLGTPAITTRGMKEEDMIKIVDFLEIAAKLAVEAQKRSGCEYADFINSLNSDKFSSEIEETKEKLKQYVSQFPVPKSPIIEHSGKRLD